MNKDQSSPPQTIGGLPVQYVDFGLPEMPDQPIKFTTFRESNQKIADNFADAFVLYLKSIGITGKLIKK